MLQVREGRDQQAPRTHAATESPNFLSSLHFGHGGSLNTILPRMKIISSCHVLPQSGHSNFRGRIESLGSITVFDDPKTEKVSLFASSSYWSGKRNAGVARNATIASRGKLLRDPNAAHELGKTTIRADWIVFWIGVQHDDIRRMALIGSIEPRKCQVLLSQCDVDIGNIVRIDVSSLRGLLQLFNNFKRFTPLALEGINIAP